MAEEKIEIEETPPVVAAAAAEEEKISDKFKVNAGAGELAVIPKKLEKVREDIMKGVYDYAKMPQISYHKFHQECIDMNSPCKRNVCGCKVTCTARCGCRRKGFDMNSCIASSFKKMARSGQWESWVLPWK